MAGSMDSTFPTADGIALDIAARQQQDDKPPSKKQSPGEWVQSNLFNTKMNTAITVILTPIALYLAYRFARFVFVTGQWEVLDVNLRLFMTGTYPQEEIWRIAWQVIGSATAAGLVAGLLRSAARDKAIETGEPMVQTSIREYLSSYWSIALFVGICMVFFVNTAGPWMVLVGSIVGAVVGWLITSRFTAGLRPYGWSLAGLVAAGSFQILSGTGGWAWLFTTAALIPAVSALVRLVPSGLLMPLAGLGAIIGIGTMVLRPGIFSLIVLLVGLYGAYLAWKDDPYDGGQIGLLMVAAVGVYFLNKAIDHTGIDWSEWGGLHIALVVAAAAILLAFPLGIMLAMGRRSTLPAIRWMSVTYIEFFRGAPLITFLLAAAFFLGFFLDSDEVPSLVTRAIAAVTLFSAAYIAEIIRGGLQAVPKGQTEAGQALGLSAPKIMRLLVLPQALRAVIPAMVGQFISLFKDTSLLTIIGVHEFLDVRALVHAQEAFRASAIAETLTFVAFGYWAFSYFMSRESQRLERRLGVGQR